MKVAQIAKIAPGVMAQAVCPKTTSMIGPTPTRCGVVASILPKVPWFTRDLSQEDIGFVTVVPRLPRLNSPYLNSVLSAATVPLSRLRDVPQLKHPKMKNFLVVDTSGRGFSAQFDELELVTSGFAQDEQDDEELEEFIQNSQEGSVLKLNNYKITRIS